MIRPSAVRRFRTLAVVLVGTFTMASCGMVLHHIKHGRIPAPAESEFGLGPRSSATGAYRVTLQPPSPLVVGRLQRVHVQVLDASGAPVNGARLGIDGGMPQHGHGLPTKPRVTGTAGPGTYVVDGLRFNMGGWWEFKVAIADAGVMDSVTFHLRF
ncbi:MAG TPA: FixH family protein [Gemmatimonadaceae bacterium]|nr:FixH family protein [Gemmatimonadaceae bacterium]